MEARYANVKICSTLPFGGGIYAADLMPHSEMTPLAIFVKPALMKY